MKLRCLLIDDELPALKVLARYVSSISDMEIVGQCRNAIEALGVLRQKTVDVIFLDIKMPRIIGTDFLKNLAQPPRVIFVTAYREYAVDGFELDAVDYLVKPVSFERFFKAITKLNRLMGRDDSTAVANEEVNAPDFIYLKVDRDMKKIFVNDILYVESWKDYVKIYLTGNRYMLVKRPISAIENLLSEHKFVRVHRSFIVSLSKVSGYNALSVQLGQKEIPIGRLYKQSILERLRGH
ncbi:MAG TPA: LytTR family DNA-binding domain-containing protein [Chitinophagaceae bacterium]|jgi:DNA-binding LytR/AlgR family response regulator|nr:LytTR family DNA-binding domain-containing protein [Chitinophagaceae bacterium]